MAWIEVQKEARTSPNQLTTLPHTQSIGLLSYLIVARLRNPTNKDQEESRDRALAKPAQLCQADSTFNFVQESKESSLRGKKHQLGHWCWSNDLSAPLGKPTSAYGRGSDRLKKGPARLLAKIRSYWTYEKSIVNKKKWGVEDMREKMSAGIERRNENHV